MQQNEGGSCLEMRKYERGQGERWRRGDRVGWQGAFLKQSSPSACPCCGKCHGACSPWARPLSGFQSVCLAQPLAFPSLWDRRKTDRMHGLEEAMHAREACKDWRKQTTLPPEPDTCVNCRKLRGAQLSWWRLHMHAAAGGKVTRRQKAGRGACVCACAHTHTHSLNRGNEQRQTDPGRQQWKIERKKEILRHGKLPPRKCLKEYDWLVLNALTLHYHRNLFAKKCK